MKHPDAHTFRRDSTSSILWPKWPRAENMSYENKNVMPPLIRRYYREATPANKFWYYVSLWGDTQNRNRPPPGRNWYYVSHRGESSGSDVRCWNVLVLCCIEAETVCRFCRNCPPFAAIVRHFCRNCPPLLPQLSAADKLRKFEIEGRRNSEKFRIHSMPQKAIILVKFPSCTKWEQGALLGHLEERQFSKN